MSILLSFEVRMAAPGGLLSGIFVGFARFLSISNRAAAKESGCFEQLRQAICSHAYEKRRCGKWHGPRSPKLHSQR
jgi:hypothetical protein